MGFAHDLVLCGGYAPGKGMGFAHGIFLGFIRHRHHCTEMTVDLDNLLRIIPTFRLLSLYWNPIHVFFEVSRWYTPVTESWYIVNYRSQKWH
jgi:hypothetical protein